MKQARMQKIKKLISKIVLTIFVLQNTAAMAAEVVADTQAVASKKPEINEVNQIPVVNIAKPDENGVSHNQYNTFQVNTPGLILNNSAIEIQTQLAGKVSANQQLAGKEASIILNEITGGNPTQLNGLIEVAGQRADIIIANPNGISGNGFGFINVGKATLTTGIPKFADGKLAAYIVNQGQISIEGKGLNSDYMPSKLEILARAAKINANVWADKEINVTTGANEIQSDILATKTIESHVEKPNIALDIAAIGGMYAGKIKLVGTEAGLGINAAGDIFAGQELSLNSQGDLNLQQSISKTGEEAIVAPMTSIVGQEKVTIEAKGNINNKAHITSRGNVKITTESNVENDGKILAGEAYQEEEADEASPEKINAANIDIIAKGKISSTGILDASQAINLTGDQVIYDKIFSQAPNINVKEKNPPKVDPKKEEEKPIRKPNQVAKLPSLDEAQKLPECIKQGKNTSLPIKADENAQAQYIPIIDKTASGRTLVQIGTANSNGVSRNRYTDFNINEDGLILNNSTQYAKTELGGYIDRNSRLGTIAAKLILNEITSSKISELNGFLEIAGNKADVVIANPNGFNINGFGVINANKAEINAGHLDKWLNKEPNYTIIGDIKINGDGIDNSRATKTNINATNIKIENAGIWSQRLGLTATGNLYNTGVINATKNAEINVKNLENTQNANIRVGNNLTVNVKEELKQSHSMIAAEGKGSIVAQNIINRDSAVINTKHELDLKTSELNNDNSAIIGGENFELTAQTINNENNGLLAAKGKLQVKDVGTINNLKSTIQAEDDIKMASQKLLNQQGSQITTKKDVTINSLEIQNKDATISAGENIKIAAKQFINQDMGAIFNNGNLNIESQASIYNIGDSVIYSGGDIKIHTDKNLVNSSGQIESEKSIDIKAENVINEKTTFKTDWTITNETIGYNIEPISGHYSASRRFNRNKHIGTIKEETSDGQILAGNDINIEVRSSLKNHYSMIDAAQNLNIQASEIENYGYQGTTIIADRGNDNHNWKYKKHGKWHRHCHMVYGTTVIPYAYDEIQEQEIGRLGVLGAGGKVTLNALTIDNKTYNAAGEEITYKEGKNGHKVGSNLGKLPEEINIKGLVVNNKVFKINQDPTAKYLVETNEQFANYQKFLSSDYLLERVKSDPEKVIKRLGDGYYEQKYVLEQITELTGRRFLDGYKDGLEQYKALMENGAAVAEKFELTVGVGLSKEQMAALTTDIVWLVGREINGQKVLVPEVYLAQLKANDLKENGALIVGNDVEIIASKDLKNIGTIKSQADLAITATNIENSSIIQGKNLEITAKENIDNRNTIKAEETAKLSAQNLTNQTQSQEQRYRKLQQTTLGEIAQITAGKALNIEAKQNIKNQGATIKSGGKLEIVAGQDIDIATVSQEKHVAVAYDQSGARIDEIHHKGSVIDGNIVLITAGENLKIAGSQIQSKKTGKLSAGENLEIKAVKDSNQSDVSVGKRGGYYFDRTAATDETVKGSIIAATDNIEITSGKDTKIKGSEVVSETGKVAVEAGGNTIIEGESEYHERLKEEHREKTGFLSSKKTDVYDYQNANYKVGSNVSGNEVSIESEKNTTIKGSQIIADKTVEIKGKEKTEIGTEEETSANEYKKQVKKSGLLSGGGLGFTIGKESQKDKYQNENSKQTGSVVGSVNGNVTIEAGKDAKITGSDVIAGKAVNINGEKVTIENSENRYVGKESHEYKKSGLTVSLGGEIVNAANNVINPIERANQVEDDRLKALYAYKAEQALKDKTAQDVSKNGINAENSLSLTVSIGSSKSESLSTSTTKIAEASEIKAGEDVNITARKDDLTIKGSTVEGKNINLKAAGNVALEASENTNKSNQDSKSSGWNVGASIGLHGGIGVNAGANKGKGEIKENGTTYKKTEVAAQATLNVESGKDTNIIGSKASGETVKITAGENLNIESLQDKESYNEKNSSSGFNISSNITDKGLDKAKITGGANKGTIDSNYESVIDQAGIYAGKGGFEVEVGKNTDLKGAVIASEADASKNKLSTDTITYSDIENKAEYSASNKGVNYNSDADVENGVVAGVAPNIGTGAKGESESTTKSAVAKGTLEIRSDKDKDLSGLSRDTKDALNKLGQIFDKKKIQEKQELAKVFGEMAFKEIGQMAAKKQVEAEFLKEAAKSYEEKAEEALKNGNAKEAKEYEEKAKQCREEEEKLSGWKEGGKNKVALHAIIGGVMAKLGESNFASGAIGAGVNEALQEELSKLDNPAAREWASAIIGASASKLVGENGQTGASTAVSGTVNNNIFDMTKGFKDGTVKGLGDDFKFLYDAATNPKEVAGQFAECVQALWEIGRSQGGFSELFDSLGTEAKQKYQEVMAIKDNGKRDYEIGALTGSTLYLLVSSGLAPEKLTIKFPKLVSKANKVRFALASESKAIKAIKTTDFMLDEVVVTAKRISKGEKILEGSSEALNGIKVSSKIEKNADEVNTWWKVEKGYDKPPYKPGTVVQEVELKETTTFVRVYDDVNSFQKGGWVMKKEDIAGLTPEQIRDKFALPGVPKYITDVTIPGGTKVRIGEANEVAGWGKGGGNQIDLMGQRGIGEEFSNPRPLE